MNYMIPLNDFESSPIQGFSRFIFVCYHSAEYPGHLTAPGLVGERYKWLSDPSGVGMVKRINGDSWLGSEQTFDEALLSSTRCEALYSIPC